MASQVIYSHVFYPYRDGEEESLCLIYNTRNKTYQIKYHFPAFGIEEYTEVLERFEWNYLFPRIGRLSEYLRDKKKREQIDSFISKVQEICVGKNKNNKIVGRA